MLPALLHQHPDSSTCNPANPCKVSRSGQNKLSRMTIYHLRLLSKANLRTSAVENDVLALEEDITKDGETDSGVALDTTEAGTITVGSEVDVSARNGVDGATNLNTKVRESRGAREGIAAGALAVLSTLDLSVVGRDDVVVDVEERSAGVSDGVNVGGGSGAAANGVASSSEFPETIRGVHIDVGDLAGVGGSVNEAEGVSTWATLLQVGGKEGLGKVGLDSVKEGRGRLRLDRVDAAERKTQEAVVGSVGHELAGDRGGGLDSLRGGGDTADNYLVGINVSSSAGAISVTNLPGFALLNFGGSDLVDGVPRLLVCRKLAREDPTGNKSLAYLNFPRTNNSGERVRGEKFPIRRVLADEDAKGSVTSSAAGLRDEAR